MRDHRIIPLETLTATFLCALWAGLAMLTPASAGGDRALGEYLASECTTCHQISGRRTGLIPSIVGWPEDQFVAVMESYREKHRDNPIMQTIAGRLSHDELTALASYFGSLKAVD